MKNILKAALALLILLPSCLEEQVNHAEYILANESGLDLDLERYSMGYGSWDENFRDSIDTLDFPAGAELMFHYKSTGSVLTPFGATDSLVLTDNDSIRVVFTPLTEGKNPYWPMYYSGGYVYSDGNNVYNEFIYVVLEENLAPAGL